MKHTFLSLMLASGLAISATAQPLERVAPEQVGLYGPQLQYADQAIYQAIADSLTPGAVLAVVRHGKMAYLRAYGNRRIYPTTEPMTTNTIFDMASCSKSMGPALCIMRLIEMGRLRLEDPVSYYVKGFKNWVNPKDSTDYTTIRIRHLLTHTSGLPAYVSPIGFEKEGNANPDALIQYISNCRRRFEPGTDFTYSCLNFITLQHVVQNISGLSLRDFARRYIYNPLHMDHTDYLPCAKDKDGKWITIDRPYWSTHKGEKERNATPDDLADIAPTEVQPDGSVLCGQVHDPLARVMNHGISGNAGVFTTADDIAVLCAMLQNGGEWRGERVLSPLGVKTMRTVPRETSSIGRALGWDVSTGYASNQGNLLSRSTYCHTGYTGTSIVIDPENDISIILLTNAVHPYDKTGVVRLRSLVSNAVAAAIMPEDSLHQPPYWAHYYKRIVQFQSEPDIKPTDIVMLGNSLTEGAGDWGKRLGREGIINRGIVGDEAMGVYQRLYQILPGHPAKIFFMIGANDISHDLSTDSIVNMIERIVQRITEESPQTKLYLQSLLPINESFGVYKRMIGKTDQIPEINSRLKPLAEKYGATWIDLFPHFVEKGTNVMRRELTSDGLHLKKDGYDIWVSQIKKYIKK